jgi:hypothetical protein
MTQERLTSLAILSIECLRAKGLDLDEVIDSFAKKKNRCKQFIL